MVDHMNWSTTEWKQNMQQMQHKLKLTFNGRKASTQAWNYRNEVQETNSKLQQEFKRADEDNLMNDLDLS